MEALSQFWNQYQIYIVSFFCGVLTYLSAKNGSIVKAISEVYLVIESVIRFLGKSLTEEDGNGGKPSFSRILGTIDTIIIIRMGMKGFEPSVAMMTIFWVSIGYAMLSRVFTTASPLLQQLIAGWAAKVQNINLPVKTEPKAE
jgi:hypothetical protein